ncbi:MAG: chloride channel protein [Pseudomonadota bacterium]|nr:chloride channel protein [Pseudomonadota bacterium]
MSDARERDPDFYSHLRSELSDGWRWVDRAIVLAYGALAGLVVVAFTFLSYVAFDFYLGLHKTAPAWLMLLWTPLVAASIVWVTRRFVPMAAGSGIPQVVAALDPALDDKGRRHFVSLKLTVAKVLLSSAGLLGGLSVGREGPSVQVAAGVMLHSQRWLRGRRNALNPHTLLVAGGAAGIAAAFNAPLAGVVFAIEELSRRMEARYSGVIIAAIVLAGLMGVSAFGSAAYFGAVTVPALSLSHLVPALLVAGVCGLVGGLFSRLLIVSLTGQSNDRLSVLRRQKPVRFAALMGLLVAIVGLVTGGMTAGSGTEAARDLLHASEPGQAASLLGVLKLVTTWLSAWSGVPGGLFAPSLSIGAGFGYNVSMLTGGQIDAALVAMGMAGFLAAVTQAPLTAFIIVMEMIDGRPMVLSLMAVAMVSATISRMISRPLYETLAMRMLAGYTASQATRAADAAASDAALAAPAAPSPAPATPAPAPTSPQTPPSPPPS